MNFSDIRAASGKLLAKSEFQIPAYLPLLDKNCAPRSHEEIINRSLALSAVVASSYGFKKEAALKWLEQESLTPFLCSTEKDFLYGSDINQQQFQAQVESLCAFAWALKFLPKLNFFEPCPNYLVKIYPDLKKSESIDRFKESAELQITEQLVQMCDLVYCLHSVLRQGSISGAKLKHPLSSIIVIERRRTLEWILSDNDWDEITLDT